MDAANALEVREDIKKLRTELKHVGGFVKSSRDISASGPVGAPARSGFFHGTGPFMPTLHPVMMRQFNNRKFNELVYVRAAGKEPEEKLTPPPTIELLPTAMNVSQHFERVGKNSDVLQDDGKKWMIAVTYNGEYVRKDMSATDPNRHSRDFHPKK